MVDTNWVKGPIYNLRTLLAASTTFQTAVAAADATEALASIYPFQTFNEDYDADNSAQPVPRVRLSYDEVGTNQNGIINWSAYYSIKADFEFTPSSADNQVAALAHMTTVQSIVNEMQTLNGTSEYLVIEDMEAAKCVEFSDPDETPAGQEFIWYGVRFMKGMR